MNFNNLKLIPENLFETNLKLRFIEIGKNKIEKSAMTTVAEARETHNDCVDDMSKNNDELYWNSEKNCFKIRPEIKNSTNEVKPCNLMIFSFCFF